MAAGPARTAGDAAPSRGSRTWLLGLACGLVVTLASPTALLLGVLLAPGLLALMVERAPARPVARTLLIFGAAFAAAPLATLWRGINTLDTVLEMLAGLRVVAIAWAAQAGGWLLGEVAPLLIRLVLEVRDHSRMTRLRAARAHYESEWGVPPEADG
jgi:hypothetical protein